MLLVQNITLSWGKEERGAEYAGMRSGFQMAYPIEAASFQMEAAESLHYFIQRGMEFLDGSRRKQRWRPYLDPCKMNLTNIAIGKREEGAFQGGNSLLAVTFFYHEQRSGKPLRRGHNKDYNLVQSPFYRKDCLNESAFVLEPGQYGRIIWNERRTDYDTGEWYYELHIVNLLHSIDKTIQSDSFTSHGPDYIYKQLAQLR